MSLRERDLYRPVHDWLVSQLWTVYPEVFDADVVGLRRGEIVAVELKLGMRSTLDRQLMLASHWADFVYAAIPSSTYRAQAAQGWKSSGYGVLLIESDGRVKVQVEAREQPYWWVKKHAYRLKRLAERNPAHPDDVAGLPACKERAAVRARALAKSESTRQAAEDARAKGGPANHSESPNSSTSKEPQ